MTSQQNPQLNIPLRRRCHQCQHYFITYEPQWPYGCRAFNFKSPRQPILDVLEAAGQMCLYFVPKKP